MNRQSVDAFIHSDVDGMEDRRRTCFRVEEAGARRLALGWRGQGLGGLF
jgi:hypothetical protein